MLQHPPVKHSGCSMHRNKSSTTRKQHSRGQRWQSTAVLLCALLGASLLGESAALGAAAVSASAPCTLHCIST
jgi:hypothetical protein